MKRLTLAVFATAVVGCVCVLCGAAVAPAPVDPEFNAAGELIFPAGYREWVIVGMGVGMTYGPTVRAEGRPAPFDNVYVKPDAYRAFLSSGKWPEGTMFVIEGRAPVERQLLANKGQTQGEVIFLEASVKDSQRFPEHGWAYFSFGSPSSPVARTKPLATSTDCYACHAQNTAVENTFVQFYPELIEVARRQGTVKTTFDPERKF
jgi:hypothetical protein